MTVADNYDDVLAQLQSAGLIVDTIETGRVRRCLVEGEGRERRGWYVAHELRLDNGDWVIVGSYGVWRGAENNAQKIELRKRELSTDQKAALKTRLAEDRKKAAAARRREVERAARRASAAWKQCSEDGECQYLGRKGVKGYGVRFSGRGNMAIPIHDVNGRIYGLQIIYGDPAVKKKKGRDKDYWPTGLEKRGHYFQIGSPQRVMLLCEGYATGATLHEATGLPVAVAFDAGNLLPVAEALYRFYRGVKILICADDDFATFGNTGVKAADAAALAVSGAWIAPQFTDDPLRAAVTEALGDEPPKERMPWKAIVDPIINGHRKLTDFNDLHHAEGLHTVRAQVEAKLLGMNWRAGEAAAPGSRNGGEGKDTGLRPIESTEELLERFSLVYGHRQTVFDHDERILMGLGDMRDACTHKETHRRWMESPQRKMVRINEVGFDPAGTDPNIKCNLWGGWPTEPKEGSCENILELLGYLCEGEENAREVYHWVLKWLAYPIQHPGAKMKTALVFHGPQGVGKNIFFEAVMAIYGEYGRIVDQAAVEDKFNDWASKKLFLIADEVVARQELFHVKNKIKGLITTEWIRINPKNVTAYEERNHCNLVFLSNETQPLVLERDDRRFAVVWTPPKLTKEVYKDVKQELDNGGIAALHHYLLNLDLGDFKPYTEPPLTRSKQELIELGMDSTERFARAWAAEDIEGVPCIPVKADQLFQLYRAWCARQGYPRYAPMPKFLAEIGKRGGFEKKRPRIFVGQSMRQVSVVFPPKAQPPEDKSQTEWVTDCVNQFDLALSEWRGEANAA